MYKNNVVFLKECETRFHLYIYKNKKLRLCKTQLVVLI